jgi:hypothetical protein
MQAVLESVHNGWQAKNRVEPSRDRLLALVGWEQRQADKLRSKG